MGNLQDTITDAAPWLKPVFQACKDVTPMLRKKRGAFSVIAIALVGISVYASYWVISWHFGVLIGERDRTIKSQVEEIKTLQPEGYTNLIKEQTRDIVESIQDIISTVENRTSPESQPASGATITSPLRTVYFAPRDVQRWDRLKTRAAVQREKILARLDTGQHTKTVDYLAPLNPELLHAVVDDLTILAGRL